MNREEKNKSYFLNSKTDKKDILAAVMNNTGNSDIKRCKAFMLHQRMYKRIQLIVIPIAKKLSVSHVSNNSNLAIIGDSSNKECIVFKQI